MAAASSPATQDLPVLPGPPLSSSSRRLPPPCWSHEETAALIDAYREKWYSLRRGNLRASHWQEVAEDVAVRCPLSSGNPPKTSVQCRHKMEKLRKRYRSELQRALATPNGHRFSSSWVHFKRMDSMEKGPSSAGLLNSVPVDEGTENDEDEDDFQNLYDNDVKHGVAYNRKHHGSISNGIGGGSGFRIRIPGQSRLEPPGTKIYRNFDENPNPNFGSTRILGDGYSERLGLGKRGRGGVGDDDMVEKKREANPIAEMVSAIKVLGEGFARMERMKMEMAREVEAMRMEMELKRTELILESQQRIVETFAKAFSDKKKKAKRSLMSES